MAILISLVLVIGIAFFAVKTYQDLTQVAQINSQRQNLQAKPIFGKQLLTNMTATKTRIFKKRCWNIIWGKLPKLRMITKKRYF